MLTIVRELLAVASSVAPWTMQLGLGARAISSVAYAFMILLVRDVALGVTGQDGGAALSPTAAIMVGVGGVVVSTVAGAILSERRHLLAVRIEAKLQQRLVEAAAAVDPLRYEDAEFHDRAARARDGVLTQPQTMLQTLVGLVGGAAGSVATLIVLLLVEPMLVPVLILAVAALVVTAVVLARTSYGFELDQTRNERERRYLLSLLTSRQAVAELRASAATRRLVDCFRDLTGNRIQANRGLVVRRTLLHILQNMMLFVALGLVVGMALWLARIGRLGAPDIAAATLALPLVATRAGQVSTAVSGLFGAALLLDDLRYLEDAAPGRIGHSTARDAEPAAVPPAEVQNHRPPHVAGRGLSFTYPSGDRPVLSAVDIDIRPGEAVALVGENGSGKSTLARVLAGIYAPSAGSLEWNGEQCTPADGELRRRQTTIVAQEFIRYELSARANIALGAGERSPSDDEVRQAARRAGIDDVLEALPQGYDTVLSTAFSGGSELSGGQWQRIALARAFLRDTPFVILDEPTTSLDARGEYELFRDVRQGLAGRSVLLITHRMRSVAAADRIYVLAHGLVVESGTHAELLASNGHYASLVQLQDSTSLLAPDG